MYTVATVTFASVHVTLYLDNTEGVFENIHSGSVFTAVVWNSNY